MKVEASKPATQPPKNKHKKKKVQQTTEEVVKEKSNPIDQIFSKAKKMKIITKKQTDKQKSQKKAKKELEKQWRQEQKARKVNQQSGYLRVDGGMKIYSQDQLNIGKGGNTKLCPIDCNCCF